MAPGITHSAAVTMLKKNRAAVISAEYGSYHGTNAVR